MMYKIFKPSNYWPGGRWEVRSVQTSELIDSFSAEWEADKFMAAARAYLKKHGDWK